MTSWTVMDRGQMKKEGKRQSLIAFHAFALRKVQWLSLLINTLTVIFLTGSTVRISVPGLFVDHEGAFRCQQANDRWYFSAHKDGDVAIVSITNLPGERKQSSSAVLLFYCEVMSCWESRITYF